jgi:hypothetical protein
MDSSKVSGFCADDWSNPGRYHGFSCSAAFGYSYFAAVTGVDHRMLRLEEKLIIKAYISIGSSSVWVEKNCDSV